MKRLVVHLIVLALAAICSGQWVEKTIWLPESIHSIEGTNVFACDSATGKVYMGGWDAEYLHVFNTATRQKLAAFEFEMTTAVVHAAPAHRVYAVSPDMSEVLMLDDRADTIVGRCEEVDEPMFAVYASRSNKVYVSSEDDEATYVFDAGPDTVVAVLYLREAVTALAYDEATNRVFCLSYDGGDSGLTVIDAAGDSVVACLPAVNGDCSALALQPGLRRLYAFGKDHESHKNELWAYDTDSLCVVHEFYLPAEWYIDAAQLVVNTTTGRLYAASSPYAGRRDNAADSIAVLNCRADTLEGFVVMPEHHYAWQIAADPVSGKTYVSPGNGDSIAVLGVPDSITHWIALPAEEAGLGLVPGRDELLVVPWNDTLYVVDCRADTVEASVSYSTLYANSLFVNPAGARVYFTAYGGVGIVGQGDSLEKYVPFGRYLQGSGPLGYSAELNRLYFGSYDTRLYVFDCSRDSLLSFDSLGIYVSGSGLVLPEYHKMYLANSDYLAYIYDLYRDTIVGVGTGFGYDLTYNPRNGLVYGSDHANRVSIIDPRTDSVIRNLTVYQVDALEVNREQNEVYASFYTGPHNTGVMVIDGVTHLPTDTIRLPTHTQMMKWVPAVNKLYASPGYTETLYVIDCLTHELLRTVATGVEYPGSLTPNLRNDKLYLTGYRGLAAINCRSDSVVGFLPEAGTWYPPAWDPARNRLYVPDGDRIIVVADDLVGTEEAGSGQQPAFRAGQNPSAGPVRFSVAATGPCRLVVFDACGRLVWQQSLAPGLQSRTVVWPRSDARGRAVPAGVYLARLESAAGSSTVKVVLK